MRTRDARIGWLSCCAALTFCLLGSSSVSFAQGNFTVAEADLVAMKLNHYYPLPEKKFHEVDFEWSFQKDTFSVKKGKAAIPADLLGKLLPKGETADEIVGKWTLKDGMLELSDIKAGKTEGRKDVSLAVYKTAPTVVRIGRNDGQYVFGIGK